MERPESVGSFRPISLCNTTYKIISKTLVGRLKIILGDLVGDFQNAFIPGRQMVDNSLIAHEVMDWIKKRKKGTLYVGVMKIDLSKAYDGIRWDFVTAVLTKMKFPPIWINWIQECLSTSMFSILVNGEPTKFFKPEIGLRQGDPLSSYLFILCMEVLSTNLIAAQAREDHSWYKIVRSAPSLSHLFFADDALFFFKAIPRVCWKLKEILSDFCEKSGEMINFEKSTIIFTPNTPRRFVSLMRKPLGMRSSSTFGKYLGCPIQVDGRNTSAFQPIVTNIQEKIHSWKFIHLSPAARLILINIVLCSMVSHILSIYLLPTKTSKQIDSTLLKFWWTSSMDRRPVY